MNRCLGVRSRQRITLVADTSVREVRAVRAECGVLRLALEGAFLSGVLGAFGTFGAQFSFRKEFGRILRHGLGHGSAVDNS